MKGQTISQGARKAIQSLRGERTAKELAEDFGISERSVIRIWAEKGKEGLTEEAARRMEVQGLMTSHYLRLVERREYYAAMADAYPDNCAWGNLEAKYDRMITEELRIMGKWDGMDSWR